LLTGHTGFKGTWLAVWLAELGAEVIGLSLDESTSFGEFGTVDLARFMDSRQGDVRDLDLVDAVMAETRPEVVLHLAAQSLVRDSYARPVETLATNVMGTVNVLDSVRRVDGVLGVVVVTSDKCYRNREWVWPYRETDALGGSDPYSASKAAADLVTDAYRASFLAERGVGVATARAGNVIGGGDWAPDRLVPDCIKAFVSGREVEVRNPASVRPWQHVLEPLSGYLSLAERLLGAPDQYSGAWNLGQSAADLWSVESVVDRLTRLWGDSAGWFLGSGAQPREAARLQVDSSKAIAGLDWAPRLSVDDALTWSVEWYRECGAGDPVDLTRRQIERFTQVGAR
jgi:CDP-glucose 4,6-dehydratase